MHIKKQPSGKFIVRGPKWLHEHLKNESEQTGYSLNDLCVDKLAARIEGPPIHPIPIRLLKTLTTKWQDFLIGIIHFQDSTSRSRIAFLVTSKFETLLLYRLWDQVSAPFYPLNFEPPVFLYDPKNEDWTDILISGNIVWDKSGKTSLLLRTQRSILVNFCKNLRATQQSAGGNTF